MEYVLFAIWCFLIAVVGGLVGLVLGNLRLPATLSLADSPAAGTGANIGISAVAAAAASYAHIRAGRINWTLFWWMAPPSVVGGVVGGYLSGVLPGDVLLAFIAAVLLFSAWQLLRPRARGLSRPRAQFDRPAAVLSGLVVGLLGGIVGLILGSLRMPALLRYVGEAPARAVGTNTLLGVVTGVSGVIGHLGSETPDWGLLALGAAASVPGAVIGSRLTGRLSEDQLLRAIGVVLIIAGTGMLVQAVT